MFVQIITYQIDPVSDADFNDGNREFAEMMTQQPGLLTKVWLKADEPAARTAASTSGVTASPARSSSPAPCSPRSRLTTRCAT